MPGGVAGDPRDLPRTPMPMAAEQLNWTPSSRIRFTEPCSKLEVAGPRCAHGNSIRMGRARDCVACKWENCA